MTSLGQWRDWQNKIMRRYLALKSETSLLSIINLPVQAPLDYMHLVLQGHTKWLIKQYFFSEKSNDFYIGNLII